MNGLQKYLNESMINGKNGLYLLELPTGVGKTYNTVEAIVEYLPFLKDKQKLIFTTTLLKNLPIDELKAKLGPEEFKRRVLVIKSNLDQIVEMKNELDKIPEEFKTIEHADLKDAITRYENSKNYPYDKVYLDSMVAKVNDTDRNFRGFIRHKLNEKFATKEEKIKAIKCEETYSWIGKIYPAVFTDEKDILLLSINKLLAKNSVIVESSYDFLNSDLLKDSIIFIDEFDATKTTIKAEIINRSIKLKNDYLKLYTAIANSILYDKFSTDLLEALNSQDNDYLNLEYAQNAARGIESRYRTNYSIKLDKEDKTEDRLFLFKDINFITVSKDIRTSPRVKFSKEFQQNIIRIKKFEESDHENSYSIYTMLSEIESFLKYFRKFVLSWASSYQVQENNKKKPLDTQFTIDNAISTILSRLRLTQEQQELILNDICARSKRGKGLLDDISYYQEGFEYYEFNDTPNNNDVTQLKYIKVNDTAEKVLLELANSAQVFGISATAEINTPVGNYNLDYIKNELKDKYHATPKWLKDEMKAELDDVFRPYKEGKIKVHVNKYKCKLEPFDVAEYCSEWIKNKFSTIEARVRNAVVEEVEIMLQDIPHQKQYIAIRYCNLFLTMCNFWQHNDIKSYLYLGMRLPKTEEKEFDIKIVNALYYQAALLAGRNKKDKVVVLGSKKFDEDKERLLERLSKGEKIFVISTYQSIGAGQNLQYKVSDNSPYVKLTNKNRNSVDYSSKDFDGIYLADTTHLTVNTQQEEKLSDEQLLNLLVQIQEVYNVGQISALIKDKCIRDAFRKYSGIKDKINNDLQDKRAITIQATRIVLQAVGRLCRTYVKNPDIYIDIEDTLLKKLYTFEIEKRILPPEMEAILKHCDQHYNNEDEEVLNNAERASTVAGRFISTYTDPIRWEIGWTPTQIDKWKRLRECVLKYPTADVKIFEQEDAVRRYYFRVKDKTNNYLFAQHSEFSYVNISLDNNIIEFEDRVNNQHKDKGYQGHAIIQKMNEQESGLLDMLKYDGLREYFKSKGYATTFTNNYYLMCPIIYSNIYKGALGEVVGEFILKQELNIELSFIDNPLLFELFDFKLSEGVYVDFKHWGLNMHRDNKSMLQHISDKLDKMNATRVYIINILKRGEFEVDNTADERIVQIPWLIDEKGAINIDALNSIKKEDYCYVNK